MRISHPEHDGIGEVTDEQYELVWKRRGWTEAPPLPELPDIAAASVPKVLEAVGDDPEKAAAVLAAERDGRNRKTLTAPLERTANPTSEEPTS